MYVIFKCRILILKNNARLQKNLNTHLISHYLKTLNSRKNVGLEDRGERDR